MAGVAPGVARRFQGRRRRECGQTRAARDHQGNITRAIEYLLANTQRDADPYPGFIEDQGDSLSRAHGHGLAMLALADAYTVTPNSPLGRKIGETLRAAVNRIEDSSKLGGLRYGLGDPKTSVALTAAGLATLQAAGVYTGPAFEEGYDFVWRQLLIRTENPTGNESPFPYYERFYLSQALLQLRDTKRYRTWAEPEMRRLLELQQASGSWQDVRYTNGMAQRNLYGAVYASACNVLFLTLPDDTLTVFHR